MRAFWIILVPGTTHVVAGLPRSLHFLLVWDYMQLSTGLYQAVTTLLRVAGLGLLNRVLHSDLYQFYPASVHFASLKPGGWTNPCSHVQFRSGILGHYYEH